MSINSTCILNTHFIGFRWDYQFSLWLYRLHMYGSMCNVIHVYMQHFLSCSHSIPCSLCNITQSWLECLNLIAWLKLIAHACKEWWMVPRKSWVLKNFSNLKILEASTVSHKVLFFCVQFISEPISHSLSWILKQWSKHVLVKLRFYHSPPLVH